LELIKDVVREIAIIVLLASFLEMLLPRSNMKRFVQVILGLFILISILNPIASLFSSDEMVFQIEAWRYQPQSSYEFDEIITNAERITQARENVAVREYEERIEKQITSLVLLVPEVNFSEVSVKVGARSSGILGGIEQVIVKIYEEQPEKQLGTKLENINIDEVVINIQEPNAINQEKKAAENDGISEDRRIAEVANLVSNFYSLPVGRIKVILQ
jgi:stage III sporulation protein AF